MWTENNIYNIIYPLKHEGILIKNKINKNNVITIKRKH